MKVQLDDRFLTVSEAATRAGRCQGWIYDRVADGRLPADRSRGRILIHARDLDRLVLADASRLTAAAARRKRKAEALRRQFRVVDNA